MQAGPKLIGQIHNAETKLQKVLRWIGTGIKFGSMFVGHALSLALVFSMGWMLSQTFLFEFILPAFKQMFMNIAAHALPAALVPWAPTIVLGSLLSIIGAQVLYAFLSDTLWEGHNAEQPWGTGLYMVSSWVAPAIAFMYGCFHGAPFVSSLVTHAMWGGGVGTAISPLVPILDSRHKREEALITVFLWIKNDFMPWVQRAWLKAKEFCQKEVLPRWNNNFSWLTGIFKRLMPTPKENSGRIIDRDNAAAQHMDARADAVGEAAVSVGHADPALLRSFDAARADVNAAVRDEPVLLSEDPVVPPDAGHRSPAP